MTDETDETRETDASPTAEDAKDVETEDAESESEDDDDDDHDHHDDKKKKDKPKKLKVEFEASMPRSEAASYFEAIVGGLRSGRLEFRQEGDTLVLSPPEQLEIEVKAQQKGDKGKIVFEIQWEERRPLEISN